MLSERQKMILRIIVDDYIQSAEPIGSRSISKRADVNFSPATIRNEMSDLEEMGYLEQPHTSAGRIPSHKGYRYYVDHLVRLGNLSVHDMDVVKLFFADRMQEMEHAISHVASILSQLTNYTSIVLGPEVFNTTLKHLQIVPLNENSAVAIIVTNTGRVEHKVIQVPDGVPLAEIEKITAILNSRMKGIPLVHLKAKLYNEMGTELSHYVTRVEEVIQMLTSIVEHKEHDERIFVGGTTNILTQPEFKDIERVKNILELLEETPILKQIINSTSAGIQVRIGTENSLEAINQCSLITATYSIEGKPLGTIGILGPTRMEYGKVISLLDYLTNDLSKVLSQWYK